MGSVHDFKPRPRKQSQFEGPAPKGDWRPPRQGWGAPFWRKHRRALLVGGAWTLILAVITAMAILNP